MTAIAQTRTRRSRGNVAMTMLCSLLALLFLVAAGMKLFACAFETTNFAHFGYAPWFMYMIGVVEFAGAIFLAIDRTRGLAALAMAAIMVGAVASHLRAGDGIGMAAPAAIALVLCLVVAYARWHDLGAIAPR